MRRISIFVGAILLLLVAASDSYAESVSFAKRYFVDRSNIAGKLYSSGNKKGNRIQVEIVIGAADQSWVFKFNCRDKWDWGKVEYASSHIREYINKHDDIEPLQMLSQAGLWGCEWISVR